MATPFLSEIKIFSFVFPPKGYALCNGQLLPINQNQALFSLLGTTYGGDGRVNFGLPNLQSRIPIHMGAGHTLGEIGGQNAHTLSISETPQHIHQVNASSATTGGTSSPAGAYLGGALNAYVPPNTGTLTQLTPGSVSTVGGSQAHLNQQPFLTLSFCIALQGIFPSQT
jgi:microcystin-dependent protein